MVWELEIIRRYKAAKRGLADRLEPNWEANKTGQRDMTKQQIVSSKCHRTAGKKAEGHKGCVNKGDSIGSKVNSAGRKRPSVIW